MKEKLKDEQKDKIKKFLVNLEIYNTLNQKYKEKEKSIKINKKKIKIIDNIEKRRRKNIQNQKIDLLKIKQLKNFLEEEVSFLQKEKEEYSFIKDISFIRQKSFFEFLSKEYQKVIKEYFLSQETFQTIAIKNNLSIRQVNKIIFTYITSVENINKL